MSERRKTVLVVDDDEGMRDTLTAVLKRDYHVLCAATGEVALQLMVKEDVELIRTQIEPDDTRMTAMASPVGAASAAIRDYQRLGYRD